MKKRLLSLLTAIVMITVVCISPVSTYAAATTRCGVTADWEAWTSTNSFPTSGYYYLNSNVTINGTVNISGTTHLDLNGKTVTFTNSEAGSAIAIPASTKLYLYDSDINGNGEITKASTARYERAFYLNNGGSLYIYGGTISNFDSAKGTEGGAVMVHNNATFELHGGSLLNCKPNLYGGAVYVCSTGKFTMTGGTISGDSAPTGGAVYVDGGTFDMSGGSITGCTANGNGGGVYVGAGSMFTMSGNSSIENCSAVSSSDQEGRYGGGVYVDGGTFTMSAGTSIKNCNVTTSGYAFGGGVSVMGTNAIFTLSGNIEGCKADAPTSYGGGVHIGRAGTFTMDGGSIKSCTAVLAGGAVGVENGSFTMSNSGVIDNCNAPNGGGVWSNVNTTVIMNNKSIVKNCSATGGKGGGVKISGTFEMTGSSIENCSAGTGGGLYYDDGTSISINNGSKLIKCSATNSGGGIYAQSGTTTMTDSSIEACETTNSGGGVRVLKPGTSFTMTNSSIIGCKAANGGGVRVEESAAFTIISGNIQDCIASGSAGGGGVFATTPSFSMAGGSITNCTTTANGGGVYIKTSGNRFDMTGGSITCCEATNGGGLYVTDSATFNLSNGNIKNCTVTGNGGGVYDNGIITLGSTAQITGNVKGGTITDGVLSGGSANNLYLCSGKTIGMGENVPASGMSVGVTTATAPTASTPVALTGDNGADYSSYFSSDNSTYELKNISNVLKLMKKGVITNSTPEGNKSANGGYISIDKENAWPDETVTITVTPNTAYTLKSLKYNGGTDHDITEAKSFTMPAADVTVTAVFEHIHSFTYSVDATNSYILKATCIDGCPNGYYANPLTLTLTKPSNLVYDGSEKAISFADGEAAAWKNATGFDAPVITYTAKEGSALTGDKAVNVGSYTATATIDTDKTATLDFTITPVTLTMDMSGVTVTKTYDKTNDATVSKGTLVGILTADNGKVSVQDSVAATFNGTNAGTGIAVTLTEDFVLSGDAAGNYALTQPAGITGSITAKDVTDTRDAESQTVIIGEGTFTAPVFHDAALDEDITGTLTYTYNSETKTKQEIEAVLATLSQSATGTISYSYVADGNYTGTITGTINYTAEGILFKVAGEAATVANAITVKDAPTYGDTWDEIITISDDIVVSVNGKTGSGTYTLNVSGTPNAGLQGYSVIFNGTVNGKSYTDVTVLSGTVTIAKADWTVTAPIAKDNLMYTGTEQALVNAGSVEEGGKLLYSTDGSDFSETISKATDAGTYNIYYKVAGDDNHNGFSGEQPIEVTIGKADWNVTAPMANSLYYTGADQELVTAGTVKDVTGAAGERMYYRLAGETDYSESIPTGNAVDTYNVEYKVAGSANYNEYTSTAPVTVTIGKTLRTDIPMVSMNGYIYAADAVPEPSVTPAQPAENPSVTYYYNTAAERTGAKAWEDISSTTLDVGTYYMFALIGATESYSECYTEFKQFDITKAECTDITAPAGLTISYNGQPQTLVSAGSSIQGTMMYSLTGNNGDFAAELPMGTNAGTYTVYYMVAGDANHNDSGSDSLTVTIAKADWNVTAPMANSLCYTGADQALVTAGMVRDVTGAAGEKMYYRQEGASDYTEAIPTGMAVGTYKVEYRVDGNANYNGYTGSLPVTVTIGKAFRTDIPKVTMDSYKYGASAIPQPFITPSRLTENPSITYYYNTAAELVGAEVWENINSTTLNAGSYYMFALIGATENYGQCYTEFAGFDIAKADPVYPQAIPVSGTEEAQGEEKTETPADEKTETPAEEYIAPAAEYDEQIEAGEALVPVKAEISDGIATVEEITEDELQDLVDEIVNVATKEVPSLVIDLSQATQDVTGVDLTAKTLEAIADIVNDESNPIESVKLELSEAIVELDAKTIEAVVEEAEGDIIRLVVEDTEEESLNKSQNATLMRLDVDRTFEAYFESAGRRIHDFKGGNAHVSLSFKPGKGKRVENYKVYYIDEKGAPQKMTTKYENGLITFVTTHFSDYAVVYENVQDILLAEAATTKKGYIRLSWNEIDGAVRYVVYGARCGKAYKQLAELDAVTDGCSFTVKKINGAKPVSGRTYKLYVVAYDALGNRIKSKAIHFIAGNTSEECGNVETITALQKSLTLTVGEKIAVGVEYTVFDDKKRVSEKHGAALRFTSDCPDVAKVSKDGTITARREGKAVIYIQDVSGKWCQAEVTVKEK